jgi:Flp pilus assembly protein TadB
MNKYKKTRISQSLFRFLILFLVTLAVTTTVAWLNDYLFIAVFSLGLGLGFGISIWLLWEQRITQQIKDYQNPYEQNSQQLPEPRTQHNTQVVEIES